jgi:hypothetical protein
VNGSLRNLRGLLQTWQIMSSSELVLTNHGFLSGASTPSRARRQQLWLRELESYVTYPPLQAPETYNLGQVLQQIKKMHEESPDQ